MGRKNSLAKNSIQMLCVMQHLDEQNLYVLWSSVFVTLVAKKDLGSYALTRAS